MRGGGLCTPESSTKQNHQPVAQVMGTGHSPRKCTAGLDNQEAVPCNATLNTLVHY